MPVTDSQVQEIRYIVSQLTLGIFRLINAVRFGDETDAGSNAHIVLLGMGVFVGMYEKRLFSIAKLAAYVGMKRATVHRHVMALIEAGVLGRNKRGGLCFNKSWLDEAIDDRANAAQLRNMIESAARRLSKMDTRLIDLDEEGG